MTSKRTMFKKVSENILEMSVNHIGCVREKPCTESMLEKSESILEMSRE